MKTIKYAILAGALLSASLYANAQQMPGGPGQPDMRIDAAQRKQLIDGMLKEMHANYVFPEKAKKVDADIRQHQQRGDYDAVTSAEKLSGLLTEHVYATTKDKHLKVFYSNRPIPVESKDKKPSAEETAEQLAGMQSQNFGIERIERLPFNVGYLALNAFAPSKDAAQSLSAAMTSLAYTDSLIIDLRKNGGGDPATVTFLASYLLDERTHMTDIYYRQGDHTEQMWSQDVVPGLRYGQKKDVYILTSKHTFSAAEDFSYAMKSLKRAIIVGETTGGGAHPGDMMRLNEHFSMFIPNGRSIGPVTKTNWEGVGVAPDMSVPAEDAMKTAQIAILKKLAGKEKNPGRLERINARIAKVGSENTAGTMAR
ncbi:MAG: S41 family peptidase [Pseudomonadota bacterium]